MAVAIAALVLPAQAQMRARVIVTECAVEGGGLVDGESSQVTITLRNTSASMPVYNVLVTGRWVEDNPPTEFERSNQVYVDQIYAGGTQDITFDVYTKQGNLSSISSVACSLTIAFSTEAQPDAVNTVLIQVPVLSGEEIQPEASEPETRIPAQVPIAQPEPGLGRRFRQLLYLAAAGVCGLACAILFLWKLKRGR